jgi:hypothetical protein
MVDRVSISSCFSVFENDDEGIHHMENDGQIENIGNDLDERAFAEHRRVGIVHTSGNIFGEQ